MLPYPLPLTLAVVLWEGNMEEINSPWKVSIISSRGQIPHPDVKEEEPETPQFFQTLADALSLARKLTISYVLRIEGPNGDVLDDKTIRGPKYLAIAEFPK
jgi:hypothetical protein